jgi:glutathione S-transferase
MGNVAFSPRPGNAERYQGAMSTLRLHYAPDNASLTIRLALEELRLPYTTCLVDRARTAQKAPAYLALNPTGLIPVLETPQGAIFETGAILLWLADAHPAQTAAQGLFPAPGDAPRGAALKWLFFVANTLHPALRMQFYPHLYVGQDSAAQSQFRQINSANIARHLALLDAAAAQATPMGSGPFAGQNPSLIDLYLAPLLRWCALYPQGETGWFALSDTPHLHAMAERLEHRPSTHAAALAEGLGPQPFTRPALATPPEGSAV